MKTFEVEGFKISIEDDLFDAAVKYYSLEEEDTAENRRFNRIHISNALRAGNCKDLNDFKSFSYETLRQRISDEEASESVKKMLIREIEEYGGHYDS